MTHLADEQLALFAALGLRAAGALEIFCFLVCDWSSLMRSQNRSVKFDQFTRQLPLQFGR